MTKELAERFEQTTAECYEHQGDWTVCFRSVSHALIGFSIIGLALGGELEAATETETIRAVGEDYKGFAALTTHTCGQDVVVS